MIPKPPESPKKHENPGSPGKTLANGVAIIESHMAIGTEYFGTEALGCVKSEAEAVALDGNAAMRNPVIPLRQYKILLFR